MLPTTFAIMPTPLANPSVCAASVLDDMASQLSVSLLEKTPQHIKTSEDPLYPPDIPAAQDPPPAIMMTTNSGINLKFLPATANNLMH